MTSNLRERILWAITRPQAVVKAEGTTISKQKELLQKQEKEWGNKMIGQTNNGQWTTLLGERLVLDVLQLRGENPRKVETKNGFKPDWETDNFILKMASNSRILLIEVPVNL